MILSTLDKSRKGGAYEQIPSLVLGQRWTPQLNSRNMMKVVLCVWIEPYIENDLSFCVWPVHTPTTSKEVLTLSASTSPLPYTGNKSCIVNTILSVMPKHTVYIDPCMGSAEVFFRKPRAEKEILNDYNGDLVNLFRVIQNNEKLAYLLGRLYLSINGELAFKQNKDRLKGVPNILDDVIETSQIFYDASWEDIQNAAAFLENQVYSFSSTGQTFGIARRDMSQRLPRLMSAYNRIRDAIILHRDYKDVITYRHADGRDDGLKKIDPDSAEAFADWLENREKGGHPWEVCRGGNSTHVSLYVGLGRVAEGCYHLALAAKSYGRCVEAIKFYLALKHAGLPVIIYGAEFIKKRLLGLERVGIVPNEVMPFYCHSRFPGEDVDSFRHLNHENPDAEIALIEWQPIKPVKLSCY